MNKMRTGFFTLLALFSLTIAKAQTADEIIAKHIDALGGKDKLSQINTVYIESTTSAMGNDAPTKTYIINGKAYKSESNFGGQEIVNVIKDTSGWMINPYAGATDPTAIPGDELKMNADQIYVEPFLNYTANGAKVDTAGQEKVGDVNAYKLKYTNKYGSETDYYIDPTTWYVVQITKQATAMGQTVTVTITPSNYKQTDFGVYMPYTTHVDMGQFAMDINTQKIQVNTDIDPKIFEMSK